MDMDRIRKLVIHNDRKIILLVMDGLGGLPLKSGGQTELSAADTPNMDALARESACGSIVPVAPGVTPGSGPAHLALFGYDPTVFDIGRGVLEALGIGFDLQKDDLAARGNFCTVNDEGIITDRRAGRISTEKCVELCRALRRIELPVEALSPFPGLSVIVEPVKEHRFVVVFRGKSLHADILDTDPSQRIQRRSASALKRIGSPEALDAVEAWKSREDDQT